MQTFRVGDRINHHTQGMATVVCAYSERDILLRLDNPCGNPYSFYSHRYKVINTKVGNWYWEPSIEMCSLVSIKHPFKGNAK